MRPIGAFVTEVVQELDDVRATWMGVCWRGRWVGCVGRGRPGRGGGGDEALKEFDFVERGFGVAGCGFDDLECDVAVLSVKQN